MNFRQPVSEAEHQSEAVLDKESATGNEPDSCSTREPEERLFGPEVFLSPDNQSPVGAKWRFDITATPRLLHGEPSVSSLKSG